MDSDTSYVIVKVPGHLQHLIMEVAGLAETGLHPLDRGVLDTV